MEVLTHQAFVLTPEQAKNKKLTIEAIIAKTNEADTAIATKVNEIVEALNSSSTPVGKTTDIHDIVFSSTTGKATVDISAFAFENINDFSFIPQIQSDRNLLSYARKIDKDTVEITVKDNESWNYNTHDLYDASEVANNVNIALFIYY